MWVVGGGWVVGVSGKDQYCSGSTVRWRLARACQYLTLILTENRIQYHFSTLLAILVLMVPDFTQIDEKIVKFEQFQNFCSKIFFPINWYKFLSKVNLFYIISRSKLNTIEKLTTPGESKFNADS